MSKRITIDVTSTDYIATCTPIVQDNTPNQTRNLGKESTGSSIQSRLSIWAYENCLGTKWPSTILWVNSIGIRNSDSWITTYPHTNLVNTGLKAKRKAVDILELNKCFHHCPKKQNKGSIKLDEERSSVSFNLLRYGKPSKSENRILLAFWAHIWRQETSVAGFLTNVFHLLISDYSCQMSAALLRNLSSYHQDH